MKRYFVGLVALTLAVSATAFTKIEKAQSTSYYWYHRTAPNTYVSDGFGVSPGTLCSGSSQICDKGFLTSQMPTGIKDNTVANTQQLQAQ